MNTLEFVHAVEEFLRRDLTEQEFDTIPELIEEGYDVQLAAELFMDRADWVRVYGEWAS